LQAQGIPGIKKGVRSFSLVKGTNFTGIFNAILSALLPATTEREAKQLEQEVNKHQEELHPFCPEKPRVIHVGK
jgi:hypothetical protein